MNDTKSPPVRRPRTVTAALVLQSLVAVIALLVLAAAWWSYADLARLIDEAVRLAPQSDADLVAARRRFNLGAALTFTAVAGLVLLWAVGTQRRLRHRRGYRAAVAGAALTALIGLSFCGGLNDGLLDLWRGPRGGGAGDPFTVALEQLSGAGFVGGDATYLLMVVAMPVVALLALAVFTLLLTPSARRWSTPDAPALPPD